MSANENAALGHFFLGIILLVAVQTVFMLGGLLVERFLGLPVTGIPTAIGLTVTLILALAVSRATSSYVLLGSFVLAFVPPVILALIVLFDTLPFHTPLIQAAIVYLALVTAAVWGYCATRILKEDL